MSPMINRSRYLPRRTFVRGLGATIALPLLDSMVPAFTAIAKTAAQPVRRLGVVYVPNGMNIWDWTPATEGAAFELPPILTPLAPFRDTLLVLSGMCNPAADGLPGEGTGDHSRAQAAFLTGVHAKKTEGADIQNGISMDQILARELGQETQLASLELALESNELAGIGEDGYSAAYSGTIAWNSATTPLPMESDPRAVFERLFGASTSTDPAARRARLQMDRSILDAVNEELARLMMVIGPGDRAKLTEYLESVRDIERRIQIAEEGSDRPLPDVDRPAGVPDAFEDYAKLMFDLMALAYQTDLTRVSTFLVGREKSSRAFPEIGVPDPHHGLSHHQSRPDRLEKLGKINNYHMQMFVHFLDRLQSTPDGDGSLLDHTMILYGAGMSNSDSHLHHDLPILLAGTGAGALDGGQHLRVGSEEQEVPLSNLHLALLEKMGLPVEQFGDSTGTVRTLSGV